ncbi:hypothetical protein [Paenibacillus physcomitrellae]|uniref:Uncharacterized protein n=1 Tax=Paenibacillus physcomitrellae TaxID=1619311 RepID=A0ABQ1FPR7_9BACL|nr:hypothetical protein [Paenibacillus physcomitrellae]GGA25434.1 hypothetical protein GCM10010917_07950 [Paenibacillus physcomitrellae]
MGWLKKAGVTAGEITGLMLGGSIRVVGELTGAKLVKEIGDGVEAATAKTGLVLGHAASGVWDVGTGLISRNEEKLETGVQDMGAAVGTTLRGVTDGIGYIYTSGKDVVQGIKDQDSDLLKQGAKNLTKAAAIGALAIGVLDLVGGADGGMVTADAADAVDSADVMDK